MAKNTVKKLQCQLCGETQFAEVCELCEDDAIYCSICDKWYDRHNDFCRHLHRTSNGFLGSGACDIECHYIKQSFFVTLDVFRTIEVEELDDYPDIIAAIQVELGKNALYLQYEGSLLGTTDLKFYRLRPDLSNNDTISLPFASIKSGYKPKIKKNGNYRFSDGLGWLMTLDAENTREANKETVDWIKEWRWLREFEISHIVHPLQGSLF